MPSYVEIIHVLPEPDGLKHDWTCPKAMPLMRKGECDCGAAERAAAEKAALPRQRLSTEGEDR